MCKLLEQKSTITLSVDFDFSLKRSAITLSDDVVSLRRDPRYLWISFSRLLLIYSVNMLRILHAWLISACFVDVDVCK